MSVQAISWVLDHSDAELGTRLVAISVANHADKYGSNAWAAVETYASEARLSKRQTQYALKELRETGELRQVGRHGLRADRATQVYEFPAMVDGVQYPHPAETHGVQSSTSRGAESGSHGVQPTAPKPSLEPSKNRPKTLAPRKRDAIWDVLVEVYGEPTTSGRGARNAAAKVLRDYGADPMEIVEFVTVISGTDRDWAVTTPSALAKHYGERVALMAQVTNGRKKHDAAAQLLREAMDG